MAITHDEALELLDQGINALATGADWERYLTVQAKFHIYSFNNVMLIAMQAPNATRVAGFRAWQEMGRQVRKGESGIRILAPMIKKDEETGDRKVVGFRSVAVFDLAQTDGEELPTPISLLTGAGPTGAREALVRFAGTLGYSVEFVTMGEPTNGQCNFDTRTISVHAERDEVMQVKTLAHELAHAMLHEETTNRALAECEAESVAFLVCKALGIDSDGYTFGYVTSWAGDGEAARATVRRSADTIRKAAERITTTIESSTSEEVAA